MPSIDDVEILVENLLSARFLFDDMTEEMSGIKEVLKLKQESPSTDKRGVLLRFVNGEEFEVVLNKTKLSNTQESIKTEPEKESTL